MSTIETSLKNYYIPRSSFEICLIDNLSIEEISNIYSWKEVKGTCKLNKFFHHIKKKFNLSVQEYCKKYLNFKWPLCPTLKVETNFIIKGHGIIISKFRPGGQTKKNCPALKKACAKLSEDKRGEKNPMYGKSPWNKGLDLSHPSIEKGAKKIRGRKASEETRKKQSIIRKANPCMGMLGKTHSPEVRKKISQNTARMYQNSKFKRVSAIEVKVRNFLEEIGIEFVEQYHLKYYSLDFALEEHTVCIECQGQFWHVDPRIYPNGPICAIQRKNFSRDKIKGDYLKRKGWQIVELWEKEIKNEEFKEILICKLKELHVLEVLE